MRNIYIITVVLFSLILSACGKPKVVEYWKGWVAQNTLSQSEKQTAVSGIINGIYDSGNLEIRHFITEQEDETGDGQYSESLVFLLLAELVICDGYDWSELYTDTWAQARLKISDLIPNFTNNQLGMSTYEKAMIDNGWDPRFASYINKLAIDKKDIFRINLSKIYGEYEWFAPFIDQTIKVIDWDYVKVADRFDAYEVIYLVSDRLYVKCRITERDTGESEIAVISQSKNLVNILK